MTDLILLAAGAARRFGRQKLLEEFKGKPLYRYAFDAARSLSGVRVLAVTRAGLLDGAAVDYRVEPVLVPEEQGIGLSVAAGAAGGGGRPPPPLVRRRIYAFSCVISPM